MRPFVIVALFIAFIISCKEDEVKTEPDKLPGATQSGRKTFGFLFNGTAWVQNSDVLAFYTIYSGTSERTLFISAGGNASHPNEKIFISLAEVEIHEGDYDFITGSRDGLLFNNGTCIYSGEPKSGEEISKLTITKFDKLHSIVSGVFYLKGEAYDACDKVEITEGRFDLTFLTNTVL